MLQKGAQIQRDEGPWDVESPINAHFNIPLELEIGDSPRVGKRLEWRSFINDARACQS
jgi:hypothetical protein